MTEDLTVEITCPACDRPWPEPMVRGALREYRHTYNERCGERFVVSVDPIGENHLLRQLADDESYRDGISHLQDEHRRRLVRAVLLELSQDFVDGERPQDGGGARVVAGPSQKEG